MKPAIRTQPLRSTRRTTVDFSLALAIGFAVLLLSTLVNLPPWAARHLAFMGRLQATGLIVNLLFAWLTVMLVTAFVKWRRAEQGRTQVESVISGISPDALLVVTPEREIVMCNRSVVRLFGYTPEELRQRKTDILYEDRRSPPGTGHEIHDALAQRGFHVGHALGKRRDGSSMPLEILTAELSEGEGAVLLVRDITERAQAEEAQRKLQVQVERQEKMASLGVLAGGVAHDFNNLLAGILGNAELAMQHVPPDEGPVRESLQEIIRATRDAAGVSRRMLAYAGTGRLQAERYDLSQAVKDAAHIVAVMVSGKHTIRYALAEGLPPVHGDPNQLQQAVFNLVSNATEAIGEQPGIVSIATGVRQCDDAYLAEALADEPLRAGRYVYLEVSDTGSGFDEAMRARIFEPFFSTKTARQGLGLVFVRSIVRGHKGALRVESRPQQGTTLTILLPADVRLPPSETPEDIRRETPTAPAGRGIHPGRGTVLVVEDEEAILSFLEPSISGEGFEAVVARTLEEGLQRYRRERGHLAAVLLDVKLGGLSSEPLLREIRALDPAARVIVCSGHEIPAEILGLKPDEILEKPFDVATLLACIRGVAPAAPRPDDSRSPRSPG